MRSVMGHLDGVTKENSPCESILRRLFDVIDDEEFDQPLPRLQFQSELFFQRLRKRRSRGWTEHIVGRVESLASLSTDLLFDMDIELSDQARLVDDETAPASV